MTRASSERDALDEAESIGKDLQKRKSKPTKEDLRNAYKKHLAGEEGYETQRAVVETLGSSKGTVSRAWKEFEEEGVTIDKDEIPEVEAETVEVPALDAVRTAIILKTGKLVEINPYVLLPAEGDDHYELSRYFQKRRAPRGYDTDIKIIAESIAKIGMVEPPTVQGASSENGFFQRTIDGFTRLMSWLLADKEAGGTFEKPVLDFPVCLLVDCTNAEGDLIALEKNQNKENFDLGDRDYSIVTMHERHKETYPQKVLVDLFNLDKRTISNIISAWQDSYPVDEKKGFTSQINPIRYALEERKITTYHGFQLARLQKWPKEQKRIANWLLEEIGKYSRKDAYLEEQYDHDETRGRYQYFKVDADGISAGHLKMMVSKAVENMQHTDAIQKVLAPRLLKEKPDSQITVQEFEDFRAKVSKERTGHSDGIPKRYVEEGLKQAGIKINRKVDIETMKPVSPATAKAIKEEPVKVCANCTFALRKDLSCQIGLEPDGNNECPVQPLSSGWPEEMKHKCLYCGGITFDDFLDNLGVDTTWEESDDGPRFVAHDLCVHDKLLKELDIKGQCHECNNHDCELLEAVANGKLDVEVKHCPEVSESRWNRWFTRRPEMSIEEINIEVQKRIDDFVKEAREQSEKMKTAGGKA